jgi:hypothetical protein
MPSTNYTRTVHVRGMEIEAAHIEDRPGGGATLDIEHPDGRKWRVGVSEQGKVKEIVTAWDSAGNVAPLEEPDWLDDALRQLAGVPA